MPRDIVACMCFFHCILFAELSLLLKLLIIFMVLSVWSGQRHFPTLVWYVAGVLHTSKQSPSKPFKPSALCSLSTYKISEGAAWLKKWRAGFCLRISINKICGPKTMDHFVSLCVFLGLVLYPISSQPAFRHVLRQVHLRFFGSSILIMLIPCCSPCLVSENGTCRLVTTSMASSERRVEELKVDKLGQVSPMSVTSVFYPCVVTSACWRENRCLRRLGYRKKKTLTISLYQSRRFSPSGSFPEEWLTGFLAGHATT